MNEIEKKALERYPHDYPERSGYIEGYKDALESVTLGIDMIICSLNMCHENPLYTPTFITIPSCMDFHTDVFALNLVKDWVEKQKKEEQP
ncbi:MAG: hypothetical protein J6X18_05690 [Bacteroidales bacterium]|nr:hypothetical protein [Bacteroidales bacterium]